VCATVAAIPPDAHASPWWYELRTITRGDLETAVTC
jgi:hypothetical protein